MGECFHTVNTPVTSNPVLLRVMQLFRQNAFVLLIVIPGVNVRWFYLLLFSNST